jgi:hypothetical protein
MFRALVNLVTEVFRAIFTPGRPSPVTAQTQRKNFSADVVRADDLLVLRLDFYNTRLKPTAGAKQIVPDGPGDSFIIVHFPPQHIAEQAFDEGPPAEVLAPPPIAARLAGESRLVFHLHPALLPLDFSLEKILSALGQCAQLITDEVTPPLPTPPVGGTARFGGVRSEYTAIEAPWRLILSPHPDTSWAHSDKAVGHGKKTELWHTRLGVKPSKGPAVDEKSSTKRTVRAVYSPDYRGSFPAPPLTDTSPFLSSLRRYHRDQIVRATADREMAGNAPAAVEQLMLSSLGAGIKLYGHWDTELDLLEWRQITTLGRDHFVKVALKGYLFPLGHKAVEITITERKPRMGTAGHLEGKPVAYLLQRRFIVLREPVKRFTHREFPFRVVEFKTLRSPNLAKTEPADIISIVSGGATSYWPRFEPSPGARQDVMFLLEGTDWDGRITSFSAPLIFVPFTADEGADIGKLVTAYNGAPAPPLIPEPEAPRRTVDTKGQKIAFAPSTPAGPGGPAKPGDTTLETDAVILAALNATGAPHFLPAMRGARVNDQSLRQISKGVASVLIRYDAAYLASAPSDFGNAGEVYAHIDAPPGVKFPVEKTGGLVAPDFTPQAFSRNFGAVGDATNFAGGSFNPGAIFAGIKILGGIPLDKIFKLIPFARPSQAGATVPGLTTTQVGNVIRTRYVWSVTSAQLQRQTGSGRPGPDPNVDPFFNPGGDAKFELDSVIDAPLDGSPSRFSVSGGIEKFEIVLPSTGEPLIGALFDSIQFSAGTGKKVDVSVKFNDIVFKGPLTFVNDIREYIPLDGFVDPPYIDVNSQGISAGFTLGIPTIGVGIFTLQDISLSAGFFLPFIGGAAALRFAFCERDHPFLLTVSLFGGGGFFGLDLDTEKVTSVEASIEFGAAIALNLGVAQGKASITAGIYYQKSGSGFNITAFFRAAGSLSVLGLITVSVELYVGLSYESDKSKPHGGYLYGTASVKVKIKIVFFSISVSVSIEREFAGSDPTFAAMLDPVDWGDYCGSFAPEP